MKPITRATRAVIVTLLVAAAPLSLKALAQGEVNAAAGLGATQAASTAAINANWKSVSVIEAGSERSSELSGSKKLNVKLPDSSSAKVAVDDSGAPQALVFKASNNLADSRQRALEAGAALNGDNSVSLPVTTNSGEQINFLIKADGSAAVAAK